jgi:hypothetical protein
MLTVWAASASAQSQYLLPSVPQAAVPEAVTPEERRPWYVGAQQSFTYESNIYRSPGVAPSVIPEVSDTISSTALLAGVDRPFGRQRIIADAAISHNRFSDESHLNHNAWRLGARLDWETIARLSGELDLRTRRDLVRHDELSLTSDIEKHLRNVNSLTLTARLGGEGRLGVEGRLGHQVVDHKSPLPEVQVRDQQQNFGSLGVVYRPSGALRLGVAARLTQGEYDDADPTPAVLPNEFDRKDIDLTAAWMPSGISALLARLSATRQDYDTQTTLQRDFSSVTGALQWDWRPTGKLRFISELLRETGDQVVFEQLLGLGTGDISTTTGLQVRSATTASIRGIWAATAKISVDGQLRHSRRSFEGASGDRATGLSVGLRWDPTRAIGVGCSVGRTTRDSDAAAREYDLDIASCFARFLLG